MIRPDYPKSVVIEEQGLRDGMQCVFGCRYEGRIDPKAVIDMLKEQLDLGIDEIELADTTGMADPLSIQKIYSPMPVETNYVQNSGNKFNSYLLFIDISCIFG